MSGSMDRTTQKDLMRQGGESSHSGRGPAAGGDFVVDQFRRQYEEEQKSVKREYDLISHDGASQPDDTSRKKGKGKERAESLSTTYEIRTQLEHTHIQSLDGNNIELHYLSGHIFTRESRKALTDSLLWSF